MLTLIVIDNSYSEGNQYHLFLQRERQPLLDSKSVFDEELTLRKFLEGTIIDDSVLSPDLTERHQARLKKLMVVLMEKGEISTLLSYAERVYMLDSPKGHVSHTVFGEWTFESAVIVPPSLRELQENVWAELAGFPKSDWRKEVADDETHLGYWEWVEAQQ
jgi:hypothetical protein